MGSGLHNDMPLAGASKDVKVEKVGDCRSHDHDHVESARQCQCDVLRVRRSLWRVQADPRQIRKDWGFASKRSVDQ